MFTTDKYGVIGQIQPQALPGGSWVEGGDSVNWLGHAIYLLEIEGKKFEGTWDSHNYVSMFEVSFGAYVRHFDPAMTYNGFGAYYKNPWNGCISRDQLTGILGALIRGKKYAAMLRLMIHHAAWLFLFSYGTIDNGKNPATAKWKWPDLTGPDIWATMLRGFGVVSWLFWPLLCVLDLHTLINAWIHNIKDEDDVLSFTMKYLVSREYVPTPTSWLASKILDKESLLEEMKEYWCGWRQNCGMYKLYEKKFKELGEI